MKKLLLILLFLSGSYAQAQNQFATISEFEVNGQRYLVDNIFGQGCPVVFNSVRMFRGVTRTADCEWWNISPLGDLSIIQTKIYTIFSEARMAEFYYNNKEDLDLYITIDGNYRVQDITFYPECNSILSKEEIHLIENTLKGTEVPKQKISGSYCNFNYFGFYAPALRLYDPKRSYPLPSNKTNDKKKN